MGISMNIIDENFLIVYLCVYGFTNSNIFFIIINNKHTLRPKGRNREWGEFVLRQIKKTKSWNVENAQLFLMESSWVFQRLRNIILH